MVSECADKTATDRIAKFGHAGQSRNPTGDDELPPILTHVQGVALPGELGDDTPGGRRPTHADSLRRQRGKHPAAQHDQLATVGRQGGGRHRHRPCVR